MDNDKLIRGVLWVAAIFNLGGALLFAFPESSLSRLAGLPAGVPGIYAALLALFIALFGGAFAWLAMQPRIDRPMVGFAAIGKLCAYLIVVAFWLSGAAPASGVLSISGDLVLAGIFLWWLRATRVPS